MELCGEPSIKVGFRSMILSHPAASPGHPSDARGASGNMADWPGTRSVCVRVFLARQLAQLPAVRA